MSFKDKFNKFNNKKEQIEDNSISNNINNEQNKQIGLEIKLPGCEEFIPLGKSQYNRIYLDDIGPRLLILADECAELLEPTGAKTTEGKEEDALKAEIVGLMKSITQLGRSAGIHMVLAPLRLSTVIPTTKGYKTMETIEVGDIVFNSNNRPVEVLGLSPIKMSESMYEIKVSIKSEFTGKVEKLTIGSDGKHRFPLIIYPFGDGNDYFIKYETLKTKEIFEIMNHINIDNKDDIYKLNSCDIYIKTSDKYIRAKIDEVVQVENELVRCIKVDSEDHLFMITDEEHFREDWERIPSIRKYSYPEETILTHNTQRNDAPLPDDLSLRVLRGNNYINILWKDLLVDDIFEDGSICKRIGEWLYEDCFEIKTEENKIIASETHCFYVNILNDKGNLINDKFESSKKSRLRLEEQDIHWMNVKDILNAFINGLEIDFLDNGKLISIEPKGVKKVRCITTNTGHYVINGFINHNSIIPGVIQSNPLSIDTKIKVLRKFK